MGKYGRKSRNQTSETHGGGGGGVWTRSRRCAMVLKPKEDRSAAANVSSRTSLRILLKFNSKQKSLPANPSSQVVATNVRTILNKKITHCVNSAMSGHTICLKRSDPVQLLENRNKKTKLIAGKTTQNDQPSPLVSSVEEQTTLVPTGRNLLSKNSRSILLQTQPKDRDSMENNYQPSLLVSPADSMEEESATLVPTGTLPLSKNKSHLLLQTQAQDQGSTEPIAHSSPLQPPTVSERSKSLFEKLMHVRSINEKNRDTIQLIQTQIHHDDAQDADAHVKSENILIDLEDDLYKVRMKHDSTLRKIMSTHGDITKDCHYGFMCSNYVEKVCVIYKALEASTIFDIDVSEMYSICRELNELQQEKIEVKWLSDRLSLRIELAKESTSFFTIRQMENREAAKIKQKEGLLEAYKVEREIYQGRIATLDKLIKEEEEELASGKRVTSVLSLCSDFLVKKFKPAFLSLGRGLF